MWLVMKKLNVEQKGAFTEDLFKNKWWIKASLTLWLILQHFESKYEGRTGIQAEP